jgi:phosphatidylglycerol:prolipoprotein diacylglycerol transferase
MGFAAVFLLGKKRAEKPYSVIKTEAMEDLVYYGVLGVIQEGRIGYALFYNITSFLDEPVLIFKVWEGGMACLVFLSSCGGLSKNRTSLCWI